MENLFITKIYIEKVRHLRGLEIILSDKERKHLILTGKNGSGKTSLLQAMSANIINYQYRDQLVKGGNIGKQGGYDIWEKHRTKLSQSDVELSTGVAISYAHNDFIFFDSTFVFIATTRAELNVPTAVENVDLLGMNVVERNAGKDFLKYILHLDYQLYGAISENNELLSKNLKLWFERFESALRFIYDCPELKLKRSTKMLQFTIEMPNREPFALHEMADGYAAFLKIYMELLMRFDTEIGNVDYNKPAIVLIDEIETHLHVELQKRVLPFLTQMFPNVQFIVATHSPFVVSSLENAIVYDLETNERLESPSFYSYDTIVESFFDVSMYSSELIGYFKRYEELCLKERSEEENKEFLRLKAELEIKALPSTELWIKFQELETRRKAANNG